MYLARVFVGSIRLVELALMYTYLSPSLQFGTV